MNLIAGLIGGALLYLVWELAAELALGLFAAVTRPIHRPVWAAFMRAKWPWPAAVLGVFGIVCGVVGAVLLQKPNTPTWINGAGLALFLGGAFIALAGPAMWFHERDRVVTSERADANHPAS